MSEATPPPAAPTGGLAPTAGDTTPENPWPLRMLSQKLKAHIERAPETWVEGQVVQHTNRGPSKMSFFTLRDTTTEASFQATAFAGVLDKVGAGFDVGARVVARVKPNFFERSGQLTVRAGEIRLQGIGSLLAQIEHLRKQLAAEGLFAPERKQKLPMFPALIGLVCGKDAKAKDDVLVNARARWPGARFRIKEVLVQGPNSAAQVAQAIGELDADVDVDVMIVARGGGSVEDLLPFSDEILVRAAARARTPLISAIGHETDSPLLDLVADFRASTPTDAARRVVPDLADELAQLVGSELAMRAAVRKSLARENELLNVIAARPVLQRPTAVLDQERAGVQQAQMRIDAAARRAVAAQIADVDRMVGVLDALSPRATLERGYSILRTPDGKVVRAASQLSPGALVEGFLGSGSFVAQVKGVNENGSLVPQTQGDQAKAKD